VRLFPVISYKEFIPTGVAVGNGLLKSSGTAKTASTPISSPGHNSAKCSNSRASLHKAQRGNRIRVYKTIVLLWFRMVMKLGL
jgi:hypothetical protein